MLYILKYEKGGTYMSDFDTRKNPIGTKARTGEICPESARWQAQGYPRPNSIAPIAKGNKMPPYSGRAVIWVLVDYA